MYEILSQLFARAAFGAAQTAIGLGHGVKTLDVSWRAFSTVERIVVIATALLCGGVFIWTGKLLGVPAQPGFSGSLLASGFAMSSLITVIIAMAICLALACIIALLIDVESGLFCCCCGMGMFAISCGPIRPVLQYATSAGVFIAMATETALLAGMIAGSWYAMEKVLRRTEKLKAIGFKTIAPNEESDVPLTKKLLTLAVQVVVMAVCEMIFIQVDAKAQALTGVAVSAFAGVLAAYMFTALPVGIWYWAGPGVLGIIGYLLAYLAGGFTQLGEVQGWAAALARPTPLDYAGVGTGAAMTAYWCSRQWGNPPEEEAEWVEPINPVEPVQASV